MEQVQKEHRVEINEISDKAGKWTLQEGMRSSVRENIETKKKDRNAGERLRRRGERTVVFKKSNKMIRSPERNIDLERMIGELSRELREGLRSVRREIRKVAEGQRR